VRIKDTDATVELYIFDCAGSELYSDMVPQFVRFFFLSDLAWFFIFIFLFQPSRHCISRPCEPFTLAKKNKTQNTIKHPIFYSIPVDPQLDWDDFS
jgi:hypothetical protein